MFSVNENGCQICGITCSSGGYRCPHCGECVCESCSQHQVLGARVCKVCYQRAASGLVAKLHVPLSVIEYHEQKNKQKYGEKFKYPCYVYVDHLSFLPQLLYDVLNHLCTTPIDNTRIIFYTYTSYDENPANDDGNKAHALCWVFEKRQGHNYFFSLEALLQPATTKILVALSQAIPHLTVAIPSMARQKSGTGCRIFTLKDCQHALQLPYLASLRLTRGYVSIENATLAINQFDLPSLFLKDTQDRATLPAAGATYVKDGKVCHFYSESGDVQGKFPRISQLEGKFRNEGVAHFEQKYNAKFLPANLGTQEAIDFRFQHLSKRNLCRLLDPKELQLLNNNLSHIPVMPEQENSTSAFSHLWNRGEQDDSFGMGSLSFD